jgi:transposase
MRRGFDGLARQVQHVLGQDPFSGHLFVFRGRRGDLLKVLFWDGQGLCLFAKRLERGRFVWPQAKDGVVAHNRSAACPDSTRGFDCAFATIDLNQQLCYYRLLSAIKERLRRRLGRFARKAQINPARP